MIEIEKDWMAVKGDKIVAKGETKDQARRAAEHLDREYDKVVANPKNA